MPLRKIILSGGGKVSRNITDVHPNGGEFLPEEFTVPFNNSERSARVYELLAEVVRNIAACNAFQDDIDADP